MRTLLVLLTCLAGASAFTNIDDKILLQYGGLAMLRDCFGETIFSHYMDEVRAAIAACKNRAIEPPLNTLLTRPDRPSQNADIMFDRAQVHKLSVRMRLASSNYSCIQQQLGYIDDSYNIQYEKIFHDIKEVGRVDKNLMEDLLKSIVGCRKFTTCLPADNIQYPLRPAEMKYLSFKNCFDIGSMAACIKKQFRDQKADYDIMDAQSFFGSASVDEKLVSFLWRHSPNFF